MALLEKRYSPDEILREVEWGTLFFFMGLFLLVGGLEEVGIIDEMAREILMLTEGDMKSTAFVILWGTGILSAVVDNIPFVAAMIPVITEFQEFGMVNMDPLWWSLALGACLGGNGTLLGSSSNLVIVGLALKERVEIKFTSYLAVGIPITLISLSVSTLYVYFKFLNHFYRAYYSILTHRERRDRMEEYAFIYFSNDFSLFCYYHYFSANGKTGNRGIEHFRFGCIYNDC